MNKHIAIFDYVLKNKYELIDVLGTTFYFKYDKTGRAWLICDNGLKYEIIENADRLYFIELKEGNCKWRWLE
jgi:hypothetical protein